MAQLKDDCFAFGDALIPYASALSDLEQRLDCVVGTENRTSPFFLGTYSGHRYCLNPKCTASR